MLKKKPFTVLFVTTMVYWALGVLGYRALAVDAIPSVALNAPTSVPIGSSFGVSVTFDNTSTNLTGYGPFIDIAFDATGADGVATLARTDSVSSVTARVSWVHIGPPATYFIRVAGFASFTTGTYTLAVSQTNFVDNDHDGMPDAWETAYFGNTNQPASGVSGDYDHDGVSNYDEFLAGSNPTNKNSRLRVTDLSVTNASRSVTWTAVPYRYYNVEVSTNLTGGGWVYLGTVTNLNALGTLGYSDPTIPLPPIRFYRVRCL